MTDDKELAEEVRAAARALCVALNKAGEARLEISCSVSNLATQTFADGTRACTNWQPVVSLRRTVHV